MIYVLLINSLMVIVTVLVHYEFLHRLTIYIPKIKIGHKYGIVIGVLGCLVAHAIEIWMYAVAYFFMNHAEGWGSLNGVVNGTLDGAFNGSLMDCGYFSFTVFTTLGFGDIQPLGDLRFLTGVESLTGLVLITWSASFLYYEMQRNWRDY